MLHRRTRLPPAARRAQLLACAIAAFAEHGLARATHGHVAERAGVSVPAVHRYFRTREDLVDAVLAEVEAYLRALVAETLTPKLPAEAALLRLAHTFARDALARPDLIRVWLDWSTGVRDGVWPRYLVLLEALHAAAERVLRAGRRAGEVPAGMDLRAAARLLIGGGHTVALMRFAGARETEVDAFIVTLVAGLARPPSPDPRGLC